MFKVSVKAHQDLLDIGTYTQEKWGVIQRDKYLDELNDSFHVLSDNKELGHPFDDIRASYRGLLVGKHIVFYIVYQYGIRIVRVLHQSMDYAKHF